MSLAWLVLAPKRITVAQAGVRGRVRWDLSG